MLRRVEALEAATREAALSKQLDLMALRAAMDQKQADLERKLLEEKAARREERLEARMEMEKERRERQVSELKAFIRFPPAFTQ